MAAVSFDREIVLNDVSAKLLIRKIDHNKKNKAVLRDINIEQKLEEGRQLLKQLFSR